MQGKLLETTCMLLYDRWMDEVMTMLLQAITSLTLPLSLPTYFYRFLVNLHGGGA